ncbi:MAG: hypothetical protein IJY50_00900 [Clostridia bacterium]|nr:hypothetical protein [Clostridia bacterium]
MMTLQEFHSRVGELIMHCQHIEEEVKMIYAALRKGDFDQNFETVRRKPLGDVLVELQVLDRSDNDPYILKEDYDYLFRMKNVRNHWCHQAYANFLYVQDFLRSPEYQRECRFLENDRERLGRLAHNLEKSRLLAVKIYKCQ